MCPEVSALDVAFQRVFARAEYMINLEVTSKKEQRVDQELLSHMLDNSSNQHSSATLQARLLYG